MGGMNLCFVGCGAIAAVRADISPAAWAWPLQAVGRTPESAGEFAREWQMQHHTGRLAEVLARTDIDAVLTCSPGEAHEAQTRSAIQAGRHMLEELPFAMNYVGGVALAALSERRGVTMMVPHATLRAGRSARACGGCCGRPPRAPRAPAGSGSETQAGVPPALALFAATCSWQRGGAARLGAVF
jgi:hypothetical protein